jgi:hypothetical protein
MKIDSEIILQQALNIPIWQVERGHGSFLTFEMGEKNSGKRKDGTIFYSGSIHLWIYLCDWKVINNDKEILHSEADECTMNTVLNVFKNKEILSILKKDDNRIEIKFTGNTVLLLSLNDFYEKSDDFFILFTPLGNVSYSKEFGFVSEIA